MLVDLDTVWERGVNCIFKKFNFFFNLIWFICFGSVLISKLIFKK